MKRSNRIINLAVFILLVPFTVWAQAPPGNRKPIFVSRTPAAFFPYRVNENYQFLVRVFDPDGDTLTFIWKLDRVLLQTGHDSTYTLLYADSLRRYSGLMCVFSDPYGLKDSTKWTFGDQVFPHVESQHVFRENPLLENYPNPFNPSTTISYQLSFPAHVRITVFNVLGIPVQTLVDQRLQTGLHQIVWSPSLPSGVYICRLEAGSYLELRKMLLIK